eukprot:g29061.t1
MLPKLEPGHGPMENDFEPVDDVLPDERETLQSSGRRRSLRNFAQADAFTLDIGDEVLSPEDRTAVAQMTGRNEKDTERSLRRLGLDEADLSDNRGVFGTQPAGCRMNLLVARVARVTEVNSFCWHSG